MHGKYCWSCVCSDERFHDHPINGTLTFWLVVAGSTLSGLDVLAEEE